jgi:hypothetical protein
MKGQVPLKIDEFAFVLLAGLFLMIILMLTWAAQPAQNITNVSNVTGIIVTAEEVSRFVSLGDFSISYILGSATLAEKNNVEAIKGYTVYYPVNLVAVVPEDRLSITTSGSIEIIVEDTNSAGNLIVEFNGEEVFNKKIYPQQISLPVEKEKIKSSNTITIKAGSPGWKFWMNTVYKIKSIKFKINFHGTFFKNFQFVLEPEEVSKFKFGRVSFRVKNFTLPLNDMIIRINERIFFRGLPTTYFSKDFGSEIYLAPGINNITFSVEKDAFYELADTTLIIVRKV